MAEEEKKGAAPEAANEPTAEELKAEIANLKKAISASNADAAKHKREAAEWSDKYKATLDEQAKQKLETEQANKAMAEKLAAYEKRETALSYKAKLMAAGYDDARSTAMAEALPAGIPDTFFEGQKAFIEALKQEQKTQKINSQPSLPAGAAPSGADAEAAEVAKILKAAGL